MQKIAKITISALLLGTSVPAMAQADGPVGEEPATTGIETIVVTARRTAESAQNTPVSLTAFSAETIAKLGIDNVADVPDFTPNLTISEQSASLTAASIYIRGVGNQEPSAVSEQGVGVYLDGVYIARSAGAIFDLVDLERIEVLRGPQGTLFGRNSIGGAIQLISRAPALDPAAEMRAGYGSDSEWHARGRVDTGRFGPFSAALTYAHHQREGFVDNLLTPDSSDPGAINSDAFLFALNGDFGDVTVDYRLDWNKRTGNGPYFQIVAGTADFRRYFGASRSLGGDPFIIGDERLGTGLQAGFINNTGELDYSSSARVFGNSLAVAYQANDQITLKSITGYREFFQDVILTLSGNGNLRGVVLDPVTFAPSIAPVVPFTGNNAPQEQWQFSQELQALMDFGDLNVVAGLYYFFEDASEFNRQGLTFVLPGGQAGINLSPVQAFGGTTESMAVFSQVTWKPGALDGRLELTGGLRYTGDRKRVILAGDVNPVKRGRVNYENVSWLGSASYRFSDQALAYVRVSSGYRSGGINPRTNVINTFEPEEVVAYEAGLKTDLFSRRLRFNLAVFQTDYDNLQIQQFAAGSSGATAEIVNAGKVRYRGAEAELTIAPTDALTLTGSVGYIDPDYKVFLFRNPATNAVLNVADEARLPQSAKFNAHVGGEYRISVGIGELSTRLDYSYRSRVYYFALDRVNPFNREVSSSPDHNLRARVALSDIVLNPRLKMELSAFGNNLTDQENIDFGIDFGGLGYGAASFKRRRTFGVELKLEYR